MYYLKTYGDGGVGSWSDDTRWHWWDEELEVGEGRNIYKKLKWILAQQWRIFSQKMLRKLCLMILTSLEVLYSSSGQCSCDKKSVGKEVSELLIFINFYSCNIRFDMGCLYLNGSSMIQRIQDIKWILMSAFQNKQLSNNVESCGQFQMTAWGGFK